MTLFPVANSFPGTGVNIPRQDIVNAVSNGAFNVTSIFGPPLGSNGPGIVPINLPSTQEFIFGGLPPGAIAEINDALTFLDGTPASRAWLAQTQGLTSGISNNPNNPIINGLSQVEIINDLASIGIVPNIGFVPTPFPN
jgi:hypothetical protein